MTGPLAAVARAAFLLYVAALPWTIAPISIAAALCGATTLALWLARRDFGSVVRPVMLPAACWLGALVLSAWFAEDRAGSLTRLGKGLMPLIVSVAAYHAAQRRDGERAIAVLLVSASLASLVALGGWAMRGAGFASRANVGGHYMTFSGQLLLWLGPALGLALAPRGPWRLPALGASAPGLLALAATFTRSAWLGAVVALGWVVGRLRPRALVLLAVAIPLLVIVAPRSYRDRLESAFDPRHPTNVERTHMWSAGVRIFRDHPITGVGLQDLHAVYERYRDPDAREPAGHLHSVPIHVAATTGVIGLAALTVLFVALFRLASPQRGSAFEGWSTGVVGALAGFLVAGLFEWNFGDEELLHLLYTLVGLAWAARAWDGGAVREAPAAGKQRP